MPLVLARYSALRTLEYFRVPRDLELRLNDMVVLKTRRGTEMGQVKSEVGNPKLGPKESVGGEVLRKTTMDDSTNFREQRFDDVKPLRRTFRELAKKHDLPMRFESAEKLLDGEKLVVYFSSEDRVDFRDFVKEFSEAADARVELRQVGARDAARLTGDVGVCGQELCCVSYIIDFVPVSMKMAKSQRISLDPAKISGQCGRLKCCLKYEDDLYNELKKTVPQEGQPCNCDGRECHACNVDVLGQKVTVDFGDGTREVKDVSEIEFETGWSDKDIRKYKRQRRAKIKAEKEARIAEKRAREERRKSQRVEAVDRRQGQDAVHPARRASDAKPEEDAEEPSAEGRGDSGEDKPQSARKRRGRRGRRRKKNNPDKSSDE
jgi:cell fate regulator YaaT (PSP1 superfamily)